MLFIRIPIIVILLFAVNSVFSYGNYFDSLTKDSQILLLDSVINSFVIQECCDTSLGACLTLKPECTIAKRFYNFTSWLIMKKEPFDECLIQLDKRYKSFFAQDTFTISPHNIPPAGDTASPIIITAYVSASCPLCKKVCIPLHVAVSNDGPLANRVQLSLKPITTRIGDMALMAANAQGKFWEFFLSLENEKRRLDTRIVMKKAKKIKLDLEQFKRDIINKDFTDKLSKFREEAVTNGVTITPTLFIDNRRYQSYKDPQWIVDAVEYKLQNTDAK